MHPTRQLKLKLEEEARIAKGAAVKIFGRDYEGASVKFGAAAMFES